MNQHERDRKLYEFVYRLESGYSIPKSLLDFMAEGAQAVLKGGKPWPVETGRPPLWSKWEGRRLCLQVFAVKQAGIPTERIFHLLPLVNPGSTEKQSERTLMRYQQAAKTMLGRNVDFDIWHDAYELRDAVNDLLTFDKLKREERKLLEAFKEKIKWVDVEECGYGH